MAVLVAAGLAAVLLRDGNDDPAAEVGAGQTRPGETTQPSSSGPADSIPPATSPAPSIPPAQKRVFDQLMGQVAEVRGLQWKGPLNLQVVSAGELARRLRQANERDLKPEVLEMQEQTLKVLGLLPDDADLRKILEDVLTGLVQGFYDTKTKELVVGGDELDVATRYTIAHEMLHALTDQVFNYGRAIDALNDAGKTEEAAAYAALLEGDAVLTQQMWAERFLSDEEALLAILGGTAGDPSAIARTPAYIIQSLYFPYDEGLKFVETLHDGGGFRAVDAAYRKPPVSTENIIDPETYQAGQGAASPALPNLGGATGCTQVFSGAVGQFDMRALLSQRLPRSDASRAAEGWNGDTFGLLRCGTSFALVDRWQTDPGTDPSRLVDALTRWAPQWSGSGRAPGADGRFSGPNGAGRIARAGGSVELVLAADTATVDRLLPALS